MADFEYNSQRENLIIPEYGRHIQKMILHTKQIEDPEKRQRMANSIIQLMNQMVPQNKNVVDYQDKLWVHLFKIADYDIDVVTSKGVKIERPTIEKTLQNLPYTQSNLKYRHYGKNLMSLIEKAKSMEPGDKQNGCIQIIAAYMKLAYRNWNRDHYVNDENIRSDLDVITGGQLKVPEDMRLDILAMSGPNAPANTITTGSNRKRRKSNNKRGNNKRRRR
ncbi:MAG: DUF4290 domain-containing protein [Saprospiraceae bacterium]|nr:DUF4290 domain-containing protein [Saprospiraceae bacterium]